MKKQIILFILLGIPFWAISQWSVNIGAETGFALEWQKIEKGSQSSTSAESTPGLSTGINAGVAYSFNDYLALGTGVGYSYARYEDPIYSSPENKEYTHLKTIRIPLNLYWSIGHSLKSVILIGLSANFNLMQHNYETGLAYSYHYTPFYTGIQLGYAYALGSRFRLGVVCYEDLGNFMTDKYFKVDPNSVDMTIRRYLFTTQLTLNYKIFGANNRTVRKSGL